MPSLICGEEYEYQLQLVDNNVTELLAKVTINRRSYSTAVEHRFYYTLESRGGRNS